MNNITLFTQLPINQYGKEKTLTINQLPTEMIAKILYYLNDVDIVNVSLLNYFWKEVTIDSIAYEKFVKITDLSIFLYKKIDKKKYPSEKQFLLNIKKNRSIFSSESIYQLNEFINNYKEMISFKLKFLKPQDIEILNNSVKSNPIFFENLFDLTKIYQRLDKAQEITEINEKESSLKTISIDLAKAGSLNIALAIIKSITENSKKIHALYQISNNLLEIGHINKALHITQMLVNYGQSGLIFNGLMLHSISNHLATIGEFDRAANISQMIRDPNLKDDALQKISEQLTLKLKA